MGSYFDLPTCQQLFKTSVKQLNTCGGNRDGVNDHALSAGAGNGTGANAVGSSVNTGIPLYKPGNAYRINNDYLSFL